VGAGHSFTDTACTNGVMLSLDDHASVLDVDRATGRVTVEAGIRLHALNRALDALELALPNLGDIDKQSIAGAISTSTHGTGARFQSIAAAVVGFRLVLADGSVLECGDHLPIGSDGHLVWRLGRVGLGALGVLSTVTLQCVPAFRLHAVERATGVDKLLAALDEHVDGTDHFEFNWIPHTPIALTKHTNRTTEPPTDGEWRRRVEQEVVENGLLGLANRLGRRAPGAVPRLARLIPDTGETVYVAQSHEVFCSPRRVRFVESEWAIPRGALLSAFADLRRLVDERLAHPIGFPVEVRFLAADDVALSTATARETAYVACHVYQGTPHEAYFAGVEDIMSAHEGRPHWGKLHRRNADELRPHYPEFDDFVALRDRLDPEGRFHNAYLDRVLGPVA
jgi:L-gulonolactone oxidase